MSRARLVYAAFERAGILAAWRRLRPGGLVLAYHNIIAAGDRPVGDPGLHLDAGLFAAQMDWLRAHYRVVPLAAALASWREGRPEPAPLAAITFDDAYRGTLRHGLPALRARGLPCTIYVTARGASQPEFFWWDVVAALRPAADRAALRDRFAGRSAPILDSLGLRATDAPLPDDCLPADWAALRGGAGADVEIGAHTAGHPLLTALGDDELRAELAGPRADIAAATGAAVTSVAYPYGAHDARVDAAAREAGYASGMALSGRRVRGAPPPFAVPRINVSPPMRGAAFAAAASGVSLRG